MVYAERATTNSIITQKSDRNQLYKPQTVTNPYTIFLGPNLLYTSGKLENRQESDVIWALMNSSSVVFKPTGFSGFHRNCFVPHFLS